tara:strand:- start:299 stop:820 length:522 start_codon:yes stop_codon:yes gene_type:complete
MGFKKTSETIAVSSRAVQQLPGQFVSNVIELPLDALNNEIFVVLAIDFAISPPDLDGSGALDSSTVCQLSVVQQSGITGLETATVLARGEAFIAADADGNGNTVAVPFTHQTNDTPDTNVDYIGIIATPNCFLELDSVNCQNPKAVAMRMWGYRAKADAATYAALVQSELLSR